MNYVQYLKCDLCFFCTEGKAFTNLISRMYKIAVITNWMGKPLNPIGYQSEFNSNIDYSKTTPSANNALKIRLKEGM